ncbi:Spy/CpxP family protein refolding chaperone [Anabaena subtropica]|uniref:P pilus assembly/Cpx signaling pathway, periplasmic inhibitor/zinc-resistance associated protein n=1 Tax=Anabaena subtropica FACHB-260 TaxID=2692884 RepID=A0ABR8CQ63_9NOST|nr:P pilus assembly/Cpx signaling pathway, periplasmic inhibitor/zinc-resistance associated protein [Anabaena subtropica]MBD2345337.1 P pilus assembly/Cpx signaling pathway, periplasmic inhibitor/zinc-resistance associated protein [Anabaena subtropica FACHB-260]
MQLKSLSLLAGVFALTLTATPFAVQAQSASSSPFLVAQSAKRGPWEALGLSNEQKTRIQQIMSNSRAQMEAVFTPEQKAKMAAARQARQAQRQQGQRPQAGQRGQRGGKNFAELNLTEEQKTRMRTIRQTSQQQIEAVLTPEQRTKLQEMKANRRQRWQQRRNNQPAPQS